MKNQLNSEIGVSCKLQVKSCKLFCLSSRVPIIARDLIQVISKISCKIEQLETTWKKWQELYLKIHKIFGNSKDYDFWHQINRATLSITNNIAEWFERQTNKEIIYFFYVSKGSCWEVRSMLYLARKLSYINDVEFSELIDVCKINI